MTDQTNTGPDDNPLAALGALGGAGLGGGAGGLDLGGMLDQVQALQQQMTEAQENQATQLITGSSGGGKITVDVTGGGDFQNVSIDPEVVDPDDVEMLEDLVLAAVRDAMAQVSESYDDAMGGFELPDLGSLGGALGGLLGGDQPD